MHVDIKAHHPHWVSKRHLVQAPLPHRRLQQTLKAGGGGLFGGLKGLFSPDEEQQQQHSQVRQPGTLAAPEFPPFRTIKSCKQGGVYDLRFYEVYPIVEVDYQRREQGYLTLGNYQDGANETGSRFGFTQPILMCYYPGGRKVMQMMVGTKKESAAAGIGSNSITSLPRPTEAGVRLGVSGGELVAVVYFNGYITPQTAEAARQTLIQAVQADGISLAEHESAGFFRVGQYGAVHTLETRVNEMLLTVKI